MSTVYKLMTTYSKLQRFHILFIPSTSILCELPFTRKTVVYSSFLKFSSYKLNSVDVQSTLHFSTSTLLKTKSETMCEGDRKVLNLYYKDILEAQKDDSILIIDVREQSEIDETGKLPGSIHIPMGDVTNALTNLSEKDFKDKFAKDKPTRDTKIILSCRSGKRSGMVQEEIQKLGYEKAYNYVGGWLDWESNQKV
ncbi:rhodanese domain-containing protein CG4456 [Calliopsis andreniformis]|uniref:rhodanese domain-containing protein CG4456 n=1 Tax=Calliopsis andreniformis TaxID=337506 RepID=UPI003FCC4D94